jgi:hypothetical protein
VLSKDQKLFIKTQKTDRDKYDDLDEWYTRAKFKISKEEEKKNFI